MEEDAVQKGTMTAFWTRNGLEQPKRIKHNSPISSVKGVAWR
jgi:hypothetical protein